MVVALDVRTGEHRPIYGMGRPNHENDVAIPGYRGPVVFSGDDTFTSGRYDPSNTVASSSVSVAALFLHRAEHELAAGRQRRPLGVRLRHARREELLRRAPGSGTVVTGHFIKVPKDIATGLNPDGSELKAADKGYPLPPTNGSWQTDLRSDHARRDRRPPVGARVLERHQQRVPVRPRRGHRVRQAARHGQRRLHRRLRQGQALDQSLDTPNFRSTNGRVWKMVLDRHDPTKVTSLTVFVEGMTPTSRRSPRSTSPTTSKRRANGMLLRRIPDRASSSPPAQADPPPRRRDSGTSRSRIRRPPRSWRRWTSPRTAEADRCRRRPPATGAPGSRPASSTPPRRSVPARS